MSTPKMKPDDRADEILTAALDVAANEGVRGLTRDAIARMAGISPALVSARMGTMAELRRKVFRAAVDRRRLAIIAEGLSLGVTACKKAPDELKRAALAILLK